MPKVSIVIPCYQNEENIPHTTKALLDSESLYSPDVEFEYVFIDDGSTDKTYKLLIEFQQTLPSKVKVIKLVRNFGTHSAALAGLNYITGDCAVFLAADLQDPPELILKMYEHWKAGVKLILANRIDREEPPQITLVSNVFHFLMRKVALPNAPRGGFDLMLFDRELSDRVVKLDEPNTHISYLFLWLGYEYVTIPYKRRKRDHGVSQWVLKKRIKAMIDSFVAFSFFPLRLISVCGFLLATVAAIYLVLIVLAKLRGDQTVQGWSSLMLVLLAVSSFQMLALGILGEYIWRVLEGVRKRPNFIVEKTVL